MPRRFSMTPDVAPSNLSCRGLQPDREAAQAYDVHQCAAAVAAPRIALMFLTRGGLPHERLWAEWLGGVAGVIPAQYVQVHSDVAMDVIRQLLGLKAGSPAVILPGSAADRRLAAHHHE